MSKQATWVLAAIAAVMLGFIVIYEQHTLSSGELESRRGQVLNRFLRDRVTQVTLQRGEEMVATMVRDTTEEETLDTMNVGTWSLTAPVQGEVDTDALDALFLACDSVTARRTISNVSDADRATFGLDHPRLILTLQVADEQQVVRVGGDEEGTEGVFVEVEGTDAAYIVGHDFFEALDQNTDHFRSKRLVPDFVPREVQRFALTAGSTETRIEAHEGRMRATQPFEGWVRASALDAMYDALLDARAVSFLPNDQASLVASPVLTAVVTHREEGEEDVTNTIRIGAACPGDASTQVAVRVDEGSIACVERASLNALFDAQAQLRETRLLMSSEDQAERIEMHEGTNLVNVELQGEDWALMHGTTRTNSDETSVHEFVRQLRAQEADAFLPATPENLAAHGLSPERATLMVRRADAAYVETIEVGSEDTTGVWVHRDDEAVIAHFVAPAAALLTPDATRFRSRELVRRDVADATTLSVTRAGVEERLIFANDTWRIEAPAQLAADRVATRDLIAQLAALHAVRWVGAEETPALTPERFRVHLTFNPPSAEGEGDEHDHDHDHEEEDEPARDDSPAAQVNDVDLIIGAETEGGAFARLAGGEEGATFVVSTELLNALLHPLADREVLAVNSSEATQLEVHDADGTTFTLTRGDNGWRVGDRAPATDATAAFMERLRSLRAREVVDYNPRDAFPSATWSVAVTTPQGVTTLELGAVDGEEVAARSSGAPVEMRFSAETARALREYRP